MSHDDHCCRGPMMNRRSAIAGIGAALSLGSINPAFAASSSSNAARLVVINIMGGVDGLSLVAPYGDPNLVKIRAPLVPAAVGTPGGMYDLGGYFGLNPAMPNVYSMYQSGQALMVHAVGNEESSRSHFQGQDYLQSGEPELLGAGWVDRLAALAPAPSGSLPATVNMGLRTPLLVQGGGPMGGYNWPTFASIPQDLLNAIIAVNKPDPLLGPAMSASFTQNAAMNGILGAAPSVPAGYKNSFASLAWAAGALMAAPNGPRIATLTTNGVDTHDSQVTRLGVQLPIIDQMLAALKTTLGAAWSSTIVMTMTEFGRTAAMNGTEGTDHGTGFALMLAGGAVAGGRVVADWPGLSPTQLYQGRDLAATVDFRAVASGVLSGHLGLSAAQLVTIFPGYTGGAMMGLVRG